MKYVGLLTLAALVVASGTVYAGGHQNASGYEDHQNEYHMDTSADEAEEEYNETEEDMADEEEESSEEVGY